MCIKNCIAKSFSFVTALGFLKWWILCRGKTSKPDLAFELCFLFQASLTYAEAQMRIDSATMNDDITTSLRGLNKLAKILKRRRIENGYVSKYVLGCVLTHES